MANPTDISKEAALGKQSGSDHPEQEGKKAIEAGNKINKQDKTSEQKEREEKKDAEKFRKQG
jgi:hypothetical protein